MSSNFSIVRGNLFEQKTEAYVNAVNCVGIMGGGIALEFKKRYPAMFAEYQKACNLGHLRPGKLHLWTDFDNGQTIINFPTKDHWRNPSTVEYIRSGLREMISTTILYKIRSVALPALGCGLGGLSLSTVQPIIADAAVEMPNVRIVLVLK